MLNIDITIDPWITQIGSVEWMLGVRRRAGKAGAEAAVKYMKAHAPVRTGRLKASWKYGSAKGYNINKGEFVIHLLNDAHEMRRGGAHYYATFVEYGFHHVWQNYKWHPGRHDQEGAAKDAAAAIVRSIEADFDTGTKRRGKGISGGRV